MVFASYSLGMDTYNEYLKKYPEIENIPTVGSLNKNTFDTEAIISLNPDLVIMPLMMKDIAQKSTENLENAGIPVLFVDFWKDPLENTQKSILVMGQVLGREKRAEDISRFYGEQMDKVYSVLNSKEENDTKQKVYVEYGSFGPSQYGMTFSTSNWGPMITKLNGINIAEGVASMAPIDPEYLLAENPDIIIIAGQYWPESKDSMILGYATNLTESRKRLQGFCTRSGWNTLNAVKNNNIHGMRILGDSGLSFTDVSISQPRSAMFSTTCSTIWESTQMLKFSLSSTSTGIQLLKKQLRISSRITM